MKYLRTGCVIQHLQYCYNIARPSNFKVIQGHGECFSHSDGRGVQWDVFLHSPNLISLLPPIFLLPLFLPSPSPFPPLSSFYSLLPPRLCLSFPSFFFSLPFSPLSVPNYHLTLPPFPLPPAFGTPVLMDLFPLYSAVLIYKMY